MSDTTVTDTDPVLELVDAGPASARRDLALIILAGVIVVAVLVAVVVLAVEGVVDATAALGTIGTVAALGGVALGRLTGRSD